MNHSSPACGLVVNVGLVVGRPGFDSVAELEKRHEKLVFTASLLDVQHYRDSLKIVIVTL